MVATRSRWYQIDLLILAFLSLAIVGGVLWVSEVGPMLRTLVALPFVILFPGYALMAILFPRAGSPPTPVDQEDGRFTEKRGIDFLERVALGIGSTVILLPFIALLLTVSDFGMTYARVLGSLALLSFVGAIFGILRRLLTHPEQRYRLPRIVPEQGVMSGDGILGLAVNITLCVSIIIAVATMGFALAMPQTGATHTDLYLLSDGDDGAVASDFPEETVAGESIEYGIGIQNAEGERMEYSIVIQIESVNATGEVTESEQLAEEIVTLENGETWEEAIAISPTLTGDDLRVSVYLYNDRVPWQPQHDTADLSLYSWLSVDESE